MYCASCGMAVSPSLSYCNRCGAELNAKDRSSNKRSEASPESLVWALTSVNELEGSKARVLPEPSFSVTDHTTHTLEPAERKRQAE